MLILAASVSCGQPPAEPPEEPVEVPAEPEESLPPLEPPLDSDGDGYPDEFEIKVAKTDPFAPNERWALLISTLGPYIEEELMYEFLTREEGIPTKNIITIFSVEATYQNIEKALAELAEKIDENDIFFLTIVAHGGTLVYREGVTEEFVGGDQAKKGKDFSYQHLDECLDKIKARATILAITGCGSESDILFNTLRDKSRVIVTTDYGNLLVELLEAQGAEITPAVSWRYVFGKPAPVGTYNIGTEDNPGILKGPSGELGFWRRLLPRDKLVKKHYNSLAEVFRAIDKNRNGYISIGESLEWVNWLRWEASKELPPEAGSTNPCRIDNLPLASELYFGDYRTKELK